MKNVILAAISALGLSNIATANGFNWCPELTASVMFSCDQFGGLTIRTAARVPNFDGTYNKDKYKISYDKMDTCLEITKPFQKKFSIVTAPKQAHFALCDKWGTLHTLLINEAAAIEKIEGPHVYQKKEDCLKAEKQFNESYL